MPTGIDPQLSRRQFLAGCTACAVAASMPAGATTGPETPSAISPTAERALGTSGEVSPHGQQLIADFDREFERERALAPAKNTIQVVEDWGLDPTGNKPINETFISKINGLSNARVVFPGDGKFRLNDDLVFSPAGPVDIIGNGATLLAPPTGLSSAIKAVGLPSGSLIQGFTIAMEPEGWSETFVETDGAVRVNNMQMKGYLAPLPREETGSHQVLTPVASTPSAKIQVRNFKAVGGTAADMHEDMGKPSSAPENQKYTPVGLWVGQSHKGTVQMVDCELRGWQNGTYAGRTKGRVQYLDGVYWNSSNSQIRGSGGTLVDGATLILNDGGWSMKRNPGPYSLGENQGVHAIRVDPGGYKGIQDEPIIIRNVLIKGTSMGKLSGLIDFEGTAGPGVIQNTKIINHIDVPAIYGEPPGSQYSPPEPAPVTNIMVEHSLVTGETTNIAEVVDRSQSRIQTTCISVPGAGPDGINGMQIGQAVSFGKQCKGKAGLKNPKKVGDGGKLPDLPPPKDGPVRGPPTTPTTPDFSERNPGIADGIANWFEDTVQFFENTVKGFLKMTILVVFGPLIALAAGAVLFIGVLLVVLLLIAAGLKALKE